ncbi:hypothetical protein NKW50_15180, partial [Acetobacter lambici]|nr:hypothetical protein [Acetobacter lambici]
KAITLHQNLLNSYAEKILIQKSLFLWGDYHATSIKMGYYTPSTGGWKVIRACATLCLHRVRLLLMKISFIQNRLFHNLTRCTTLP